MLQLDKNTIGNLESKGVEKILIFFYDAGCSGKKVDINEDFEVSEILIKIDTDYMFNIYVYKNDVEKFHGARITRTITADHTGTEKIRYIFSNKQVKQRCGCGSSFSFEKKKMVLDLNKLKDLKKLFRR